MTTPHADEPQADQQDGDLGERLAGWLEGLGLAEHLAAAKLPTFVRDCGGRARWADPGTGEPLTEEQLTQLDGLLHSEGSERQHAMPLELLQIARQARLREELLASPWFDYERLGAVRGTTTEATRFAVHKAASNNLLLVVPVEERSIVPGFQLTAEGVLRPELAEVLESLLSARMDPWRAWGWLTQPAALLGGLVPEQAAADPEHAQLVRHAAARLAERVAAS